MNISPSGYVPYTVRTPMRPDTDTTPKPLVPAGPDAGKSTFPQHRDSAVQQTDGVSDQHSQSDNASRQADQPSSRGETKQNGKPLTDAELRVVRQLKEIDADVRRHEMAHIAAGGRYVTSGASFSYKRGPDGINYAVAGEVGIDTSPVPGDPEATIQKMRQIKASALAPADPSPQDLKVAAKATSLSTKAMSDLMHLQVQERSGKADRSDGSGFNRKEASDSYIRVGSLPESSTTTFRIAV